MPPVRIRTPCMNCGGEVTAIRKLEINGLTYYDVVCDTCGYTVRKRRRGDAISSWNMRSKVAHSSRIDPEIKQLRKLIRQLIDKAMFDEDMKTHPLYKPYMTLLYFMQKQIKMIKSLYPKGDEESDEPSTIKRKTSRSKSSN